MEKQHENSTKLRYVLGTYFLKYRDVKGVISRLKIFSYYIYSLTNQNSIVEEINSRLRSGNACYHSVQNLLSSRLLSKKLNIKIYRTIILPVVLYGCETWSLTLRKKGS